MMQNLDVVNFKKLNFGCLLFKLWFYLENKTNTIYEFAHPLLDPIGSQYISAISVTIRAIKTIKTIKTIINLNNQ